MTAKENSLSLSGPLGVFYFAADAGDSTSPQRQVQFFGCDILKVRKLVLADCKSVSRLPLTRSPAIGVVRIRDLSLPLLDLGAALSLSPLGEAETITCLVVEHRERLVALRIAQPGSICNVDWADVKAFGFDALNRQGIFHGLVEDTEAHHVISVLNMENLLDQIEAFIPENETPDLTL